jgi:hypothetical protein
MYCHLRYQYRYDNSASSAAANNILASSWLRGLGGMYDKMMMNKEEME